MLSKKTKKFNLILNAITFSAILIAVFCAALLPTYYLFPNLIVLGLSILFLLNSYSWYCSGYKLGVLFPFLLIGIILYLYIPYVLKTDPEGFGLLSLNFVIFGVPIYFGNLIAFLIIKPKK